MAKVTSEKLDARVEVAEKARSVRPRPQPDPETEALAMAIAEAARDNKGTQVVVLGVGHRTAFTDYFVICSGRSDRQVQAIADGIQRDIKDRLQVSPKGVEGESQAQWVLIDYGLVVAHVFYEHMRGFYDLEGLWSDAPRVELPDEPPPRSSAADRG